MSAPFPFLTTEQIPAMRACVATWPVLGEWIERFNKAEKAAE